jgi:hypothetical protein
VRALVGVSRWAIYEIAQSGNGFAHDGVYGRAGEHHAAAAIAVANDNQF